MPRTLPGTVYLPSSGDKPPEPAPYVLTEAETVRLLRMEGVADPYAALRRYREKGLRGTQLGKFVRYQLPDVLDFLERHREENPR